MVTGLTIVLSGLYTGEAEGVGLTMAAFNKLLPGNWGQYVVLCASVLFGFSCLITYYNYLEKSWISLFGKSKESVKTSKLIVRIIWLVFILVGSYSTLGVVWDLADTCNGIIIIPNLIALAVMAGQVAKIKEDYWKKNLPLYKEEKGKK